MSGGQLSFESLREANLARLPHFKNRKGGPAHSEKDGSDWRLSAWANAVEGEMGEMVEALLVFKSMGAAANIVKKVERGDMTLEEARKKLADELADVQTYLDILAFRAGIDLAQATISKWNEVSERVGYGGRLSGPFGFLPPTLVAQQPENKPIL